MKKGSKNHYDVLGVSQDATDEEIKQAFHNFAKNNHPDRKPDHKDAEHLFKEASAAYEALKDPLQRQAFDEVLAFDKTKRTAGRRQWRRLAMLFALLFFAPSVILYSVLMSDDDSVINDLTAALQRAGDSSAIATISDSRDGASGNEDEELPSGSGGNAQRNVAAVISEGDAESSRSQNGGSQSGAGTPLQDDILKAAPNEQASPKTVLQGNQSQPTANVENDAGSSTKVASRTDGAVPQTPIPSGQSAAHDSPARPPIILTKNVDVSGPFSDCSSCPLMFIPRRALDGLEGTDLAISMSEITIAQWNICVENGACPEYGVSSTRKNQSSPVTGIAKEGASQYASWLSRVTGQTYAAALNADGGCRTTVPGRVASNRWSWSNDLANEDCSKTKPDGKNSQGFLVTRRVEPGS